jgi:predicted deacylase
VPRPLGAPIILPAAIRDGSLRQAAARRQIPTLLYEGGEALRFSEDAIVAGVDGIRRVLDYLGMYSVAAPTSVPLSVEAGETRWARASRGGFWHGHVTLGQVVARRQALGFIADASGDKAVEVRSPLDGWVIGLSQNPLIHQGDALVHIATAANAGGCHQ